MSSQYFDLNITQLKCNGTDQKLSHVIIEVEGKNLKVSNISGKYRVSKVDIIQTVVDDKLRKVLASDGLKIIFSNDIATEEKLKKLINCLAISCPDISNKTSKSYPTNTLTDNSSSTTKRDTSYRSTSLILEAKNSMLSSAKSASMKFVAVQSPAEVIKYVHHFFLMPFISVHSKKTTRIIFIILKNHYLVHLRLYLLYDLRLNQLPSSKIILQKRLYLHRFLVCLGTQMMPRHN